ncbi:MAG: lytic transglycosylase domain-containing protein [Spirochaetia bacterium]|nr:lytic transglycosylase domain-containing protein [Spirochaetia bacterium]
MKTMKFKETVQKLEGFLTKARKQGIPGRFFIKKRVLVPSIAVLLIFMKQYEPLNYLESAAQRERVMLFIAKENKQIAPAERNLLVESILTESRRLEIPRTMQIDGRPVNKVHFLTALIRVESVFHRYAVSPVDARGYMQLMPSTVAWMDGVRGTSTPSGNLFHTATNLERGVSYLNMLFREMPDVRQVCLAYNAGPGAVRAGLYEERYWTRILDFYRELEKGDLAPKGREKKVKGAITL